MSFTIRLSQVVILSISDHITRNSIQNTGGSSRVVGALLGNQDGRTINIQSTCELLANISNEEKILSIDLDYIPQKLDLLKQVNLNLEFLGWYSNQTVNHKDLDENDLLVSQSLLKFNENPIFLSFDTTKQMKLTNELPIKIFEIKVDHSKPISQSHYVMKEIEYEIDIGKTESISIDHVLKNYNSSESSPMADHLNSLLNSIKILRKKMECLLDLVQNDINFRNDPILMKELKEILNSFPKKEKEINDIMIEESCENSIVTCLSALVGINKIVSEVSILNPNIEHSKNLKYFMMEFE